MVFPTDNIIDIDAVLGFTLSTPILPIQGHAIHLWKWMMTMLALQQQQMSQPPLTMML
jgi:hypothetical protein